MTRLRREPMFDLIELFFFAYRDFVGDADRLLTRYNFGRAHHRVLYFVDRRPGLSVAELLDLLKITKQSLSRVLKDLLDQNYIEQRPGLLDRRQRLMFPTDKGEALALELAELQSRRFARALELLPAGRARPGAQPFLPPCATRRQATRRRAARRKGDQCEWRSRDRRRAMTEADNPPPADDALHLLIVDDDRRIRNLLKRFLQGEGYRVTAAESAEDAYAHMRGLHFDLLILDVMMPGQNGYEFAAQDPRGERAARRGADPDADRPRRHRRPREGAGSRRRRLHGQAVRAARTGPARRLHPAPRRAALAPAQSAPGQNAVRFGEFIFDPDRGELRQGDEVIRITERERDMLRMLVETPGEAVSREALGGGGGAANERTVDVQVNRLRRKIETDPANPLHLQTVRGFGYKLAIDR